jgi:hypothetical protein
MFHRRHVRGGRKRGSGVGKTNRGKGTKLVAVVDRTDLPVAVHTAAATPHEVTLVLETLTATFPSEHPDRLIGDKTYDNDPLDLRSR